MGGTPTENRCCCCGCRDCSCCGWRNAGCLDCCSRTRRATRAVPKTRRPHGRPQQGGFPHRHGDAVWRISKPKNRERGAARAATPLTRRFSEQQSGFSDQWKRGAAHQPKTDEVVAVDGIVPEAVDGTQGVWTAVPGPAAQHAPPAVITASGFPSRTVVWPLLPIIGIMPAVLHPLPDIACCFLDT